VQIKKSLTVSHEQVRHRHRLLAPLRHHRSVPQLPSSFDSQTVAVLFDLLNSHFTQKKKVIFMIYVKIDFTFRTQLSSRNEKSFPPVHVRTETFFYTFCISYFIFQRST
jgi:hypothetical protein